MEKRSVLSKDSVSEPLDLPFFYFVKTRSRVGTKAKQNRQIGTSFRFFWTPSSGPGMRLLVALWLRLGGGFLPGDPGAPWQGRKSSGDEVSGEPPWPLSGTSPPSAGAAREGFAPGTRRGGAAGRVSEERSPGGLRLGMAGWVSCFGFFGGFPLGFPHRRHRVKEKRVHKAPKRASACSARPVSVGAWGVPSRHTIVAVARMQDVPFVVGHLGRQLSKIRSRRHPVKPRIGQSWRSTRRRDLRDG
jgi:hypothetical protein